MSTNVVNPTLLGGTDVCGSVAHVQDHDNPYTQPESNRQTLNKPPVNQLTQTNQKKEVADDVNEDDLNEPVLIKSSSSTPIVTLLEQACLVNFHAFRSLFSIRHQSTEFILPTRLFQQEMKCLNMLKNLVTALIPRHPQYPNHLELVEIYDRTIELVGAFEKIDLVVVSREAVTVEYYQHTIEACSHLLRALSEPAPGCSLGDAKIAPIESVSDAILTQTELPVAQQILKEYHAIKEAAQEYVTILSDADRDLLDSDETNAAQDLNTEQLNFVRTALMKYWKINIDPMTTLMKQVKLFKGTVPQHPTTVNDELHQPVHVVFHNIPSSPPPAAAVKPDLHIVSPERVSSTPIHIIAPSPPPVQIHHDQSRMTPDLKSNDKISRSADVDGVPLTGIVIESGQPIQQQLPQSSVPIIVPATTPFSPSPMHKQHRVTHPTPLAHTTNQSFGPSYQSPSPYPPAPVPTIPYSSQFKSMPPPPAPIPPSTPRYVPYSYPPPSSSDTTNDAVNRNSPDSILESDAVFCSRVFWLLILFGSLAGLVAGLAIWASQEKSFTPDEIFAIVASAFLAVCIGLFSFVEWRNRSAGTGVHGLGGNILLGLAFFLFQVSAQLFCSMGSSWIIGPVSQLISCGIVLCLSGIFFIYRIPHYPRIEPGCETGGTAAWVPSTIAPLLVAFIGIGLWPEKDVLVDGRTGVPIYVIVALLYLQALIYAFVANNGFLWIFVSFCMAITPIAWQIGLMTIIHTDPNEQNDHAYSPVILLFLNMIPHAVLLGVMGFKGVKHIRIKSVFLNSSVVCFSTVLVVYQFIAWLRGWSIDTIRESDWTNGHHSSLAVLLASLQLLYLPAYLYGMWFGFPFVLALSIWFLSSEPLLVVWPCFLLITVGVTSTQQRLAFMPVASSVALKVEQAEMELVHEAQSIPQMSMRPSALQLRAESHAFQSTLLYLTSVIVLVGWLFHSHVVKEVRIPQEYLVCAFVLTLFTATLLMIQSIRHDQWSQIDSEAAKGPQLHDHTLPPPIEIPIHTIDWNDNSISFLLVLSTLTLSLSGYSFRSEQVRWDNSPYVISLYLLHWIFLNLCLHRSHSDFARYFRFVWLAWFGVAGLVYGLFEGADWYGYRNTIVQTHQIFIAVCASLSGVDSLMGWIWSDLPVQKNITTGLNTSGEQGQPILSAPPSRRTKSILSFLSVRSDDVHLSPIPAVILLLLLIGAGVPRYGRGGGLSADDWWFLPVGVGFLVVWTACIFDLLILYYPNKGVSTGRTQSSLVPNQSILALSSEHSQTHAEIADKIVGGWFDISWLWLMLFSCLAGRITDGIFPSIVGGLSLLRLVATVEGTIKSRCDEIASTKAIMNQMTTRQSTIDSTTKAHQHPSSDNIPESEPNLMSQLKLQQTSLQDGVEFLHYCFIIVTLYWILVHVCTLPQPVSDSVMWIGSGLLVIGYSYEFIGWLLEQRLAECEMKYQDDQHYKLRSSILEYVGVFMLTTSSHGWVPLGFAILSTLQWAYQRNGIFISYYSPLLLSIGMVLIMFVGDLYPDESVWFRINIVALPTWTLMYLVYLWHRITIIPSEWRLDMDMKSHPTLSAIMCTDEISIDGTKTYLLVMCFSLSFITFQLAYGVTTWVSVLTIVVNIILNPQTRYDLVEWLPIPFLFSVATFVTYWPSNHTHNAHSIELSILIPIYAMSFLIPIPSLFNFDYLDGNILPLYGYVIESLISSLVFMFVDYDFLSMFCWSCLVWGGGYLLIGWHMCQSQPRYTGTLLLMVGIVVSAWTHWKDSRYVAIYTVGSAVLMVGVCMNALAAGVLPCWPLLKEDARRTQFQLKRHQESMDQLHQQQQRTRV